MTFGFGVHRCLGSNLVTGIQNKGDEKHGTHGTAARILRASYVMDAEPDPENPPRLAHGNLHNAWESVPMILTTPWQTGARVPRHRRRSSLKDPLILPDHVRGLFPDHGSRHMGVAR